MKEVSIGDVVVGTVEPFTGKEFVVTGVEQNPLYTKYIGKHIIAEDPYGTTHALRFGEFTVKEKKKPIDLTPEHVEYEVGDPIIINAEYRTNGLQKPFYQVFKVDEGKHGIAVVDDYGHIVWLQNYKFRKANLQDDFFNIMSNVAYKLNRIEKAYLEFFEKVAEKAKETVDNINN